MATSTSIGRSVPSERRVRSVRASTRLVVAVALLAGLTPAIAGEDPLNRDGGLTPAYPYGYSDGGDEYPDEEPDRWQLPGPFSLLAPDPELQSLVFGPTFRNEESRTELGGAVGYVNSKWRVPFQFSVETTWARLKRQPEDDRNFRRVRVAGDGELWRRSGHYEGTAVALTGFFQNQNETFRTWETGVAVTQVIGKRWSITGNGLWRRRYLVNGTTKVLDAGVAAFGTSYNLGAGVRFGGFYELFNQVDASDDWGMFLSYQFLPWAEFIVDGGKFQFVRARLLFSYALERP